MAKIITENFRAETTKELFDSFDSTSVRVPSTYYVMGSVLTQEDTIENTQVSSRNFLRKVIFGNQIDESSVRYMFPLTLWEQGKIYDAFDDTKDVSTLDMFAVVLGDGGDSSELNQAPYKVYKCIKNGLGAPSTRIPSTYSVDDPVLSENDFVITLDDGYQWKYMFEVSPAEYVLYGTQNLLPFPYPGDTGVIASARESISDIKIEQTQLNLFSKYAAFTYIDGNSSTGVSIRTTETQNQNKTLVVSYPLSSIDRFTSSDAYVGMYLITPVKGLVYEIISSRTITLGGQSFLEIVVNNEEFNSISNTADLDLNTNSEKNYSIVPKVEVSRSSGTRCVAYAKLDPFGNMEDVIIVDGGTEYKFATAKVVLPFPLLQNDANPPAGYVRTQLRCIVSPRGGHGSNPVKEMAMSRLGIATTFSGASLDIPKTNTYTQVGLVKNPQFADDSTPIRFDNRTKLTFSGPVLSTKIFKNYYIHQQVKEGSTLIETVTGQVHEVFYDADNDLTIIYIVNNVADFSAKFTAPGVITYKPDVDQLGDGIEYALNSVEDSKYVPYSGDLLHFVDFSAIERTETSLEKIKFVFDF